MRYQKSCTKYVQIYGTYQVVQQLSVKLSLHGANLRKFWFWCFLGFFSIILMEKNTIRNGSKGHRFGSCSICHAKANSPKAILTVYHLLIFLYFPRSIFTGTLGKPIMVSSNYVRCQTRGACRFYLYHVSFEPQLESRKLKQALVSRDRDLHQGYFKPDTMLISPVDFIVSPATVSN